MQLLQNKARAVRAASSSRRVVTVKAVAAPEAIKTLNTTRSDQVRREACKSRRPSTPSLYLHPRSAPPRDPYPTPFRGARGGSA